MFRGGGTSFLLSKLLFELPRALDRLTRIEVLQFEQLSKLDLAFRLFTGRRGGALTLTIIMNRIALAPFVPLVSGRTRVVRLA
jgi:hypothetical protein